jgi:hypothetical protein
MNFFIRHWSQNSSGFRPPFLYQRVHNPLLRNQTWPIYDNFQMRPEYTLKKGLPSINNTFVQKISFFSMTLLLGVEIKLWRI